ncbi:MAG: hypothetical protein WAW60_03960 [Candidatus Saccharimonadales bacterium]
MTTQKYYMAAGQDPLRAKQTAEKVSVFRQADMMHAITFTVAVCAALVPPLLGAPARVTMMVIGSIMIAAIVFGLWVTKAYRRRMFVIGYGLMAALSGYIFYLGYMYPSLG